MSRYLKELLPQSAVKLLPCNQIPHSSRTSPNLVACSKEDLRFRQLTVSKKVLQGSLLVLWLTGRLFTSQLLNSTASGTTA